MRGDAGAGKTAPRVGVLRICETGCGYASVAGLQQPVGEGGSI
jgi:hypothetical protein